MREGLGVEPIKAVCRVALVVRASYEITLLSSALPWMHHRLFIGRFSTGDLLERKTME